MEVQKSTAAVAAVALVTGTVAVVDPVWMQLLWPPRQNASTRLMQAWGISTVGLGLALAGVDVRKSAAGVCAFSVLWDLEWGGTMGKVAAGLNVAGVALLFAGGLA